MKRERKNEFPVNNVDMYPADPLGSYTGRPGDINDVPVQDADDL